MKLENPIYESDPYLADFKPDLDRRHEKMAKTISSIEGNLLTDFTLNYGPNQKVSDQKSWWSKDRTQDLRPGKNLIFYIVDSEGIEAFTKSYSEFGLHVRPDNSVVGLEWAPQGTGPDWTVQFWRWPDSDI